MGFSKEDKWKRLLRGAKIVLFLITMVMSFLIFSAPILLVIADAVVPSALLSAFSTSSLLSHFDSYDFESSLIDIPLVCIIRSLVIFSVYCFCDGPRLSRGPYLWVTTVCSGMSMMFVGLKGVSVFGNSNHGVGDGGSGIVLLVWCCGFAVGHVVVAYRTSCRERRKLLVYKIDLEAISAGKNGYPKIHAEERVK